MYINANDTIGKSDSITINNAIKRAKESNINKVLIPKENKRTSSDIWVIDEVLSLPSNIEILIDGAHLVLADNTYINMFATENYLAGKIFGLENINIHGQNGALLDGGNYNGLSEFNSGKDGMPHISCNTLMMFCHTKHLSVTNLKIQNQRWWGITNMFVSHSEFKNIEFKADLSRIDENGIHYPDELPRTYDEIYVKNADGIDLRLGCHHIVIENITGFTEDDTIALTAICGILLKPWLIPDASPDICNIVIKDVASDAYTTSNVRLLAEEGFKIHDVLIDGVTDTRSNEHYCAKAAVRIGDVLYGRKTSTLGDTYNITIRNIDSKARVGVTVCKGLKDSVIENVNYSGDGIPFGMLKCGDLKNVSLKNIKTVCDTSAIYNDIRTLI